VTGLLGITGRQGVVRLVYGERVEGLVCESGRHSRHGTVPWYYGKPYDMECSVEGCDVPAARGLGRDDAEALCDCHMEDWSSFLSKAGGVHGKGGLNTRRWEALFAQFRLREDQ
jgi:hypothetical protein